MQTRSILALFLLGLSACASSLPNAYAPVPRITFLHLNDTYRVGAVEDGTRGGFGRVTTVIRELEREGREVRLLHGGDFLYPSLESQLWDGEQMVDAFNFLHALAPLVVVPGNHEFDPRSPDALREAITRSNFAWLGGNLTLDTGDPAVDAALPAERVIDIGGFRVGIFGLTLVPGNGGNARDYIEYEDSYIDSARDSLETLAKADVDAVIGLTHLHMEDDRRISALKSEFNDFLFIVGGHEHEPEHQPASDGRAAIMKGASNARAIWRIDIDVDTGGEPVLSTSMIDLDDRIAEDPEYVTEVSDKWRKRLLARIPFLTAVLGYAAVRFDAREVTLRNQESNWGNFIVDRMRTAFGDEPPADLAFLNSGTLRIDDYIAGDITYEDIARTFGFSSYLQYMTMSGGQFRRLLEAGYRGEGPSKGYFPQVSGFRVCVDRSRPEGQRIVQMQLPAGGGWEPIDPDEDYLVVAPEYLVGRGDGYRFPEDAEPSRPGSELKYLVIDAIVSASAEGEAVGEPVDPAKPRIAFAASPGRLCFSD